MIKNIIEKFIIKSKFPKIIEDEWFAYQACEKHKGKEQLPEYFSEKTGKYVEYKVGNIVPLRIKNNYKAFYKIISWKKPYGDYAMWDDGKKYTLCLHHIELIKLVQKEIGGKSEEIS